MKEMELKIEGMMCTGCENRVQNALKTIDGVEEVKANHQDGTVIVKANDNVELSAIEEKVEDIGYEVKEAK